MIDNVSKALVSAMLSSRDIAPDVEEKTVNQAAACLSAKIRNMPVLLRMAMTVLMGVFNVWGVLAAGRLFTQLDTAGRQQQISHWKKSSIGVCREFVSFFEKMTVFIYFSLCPSRI